MSTDSFAMSNPESTRFLICMTAVVLLVASAAVNGASVAVDSKSADVAQPENVQPDTDAAAHLRIKKPETEASVAEEQNPSDPRIGYGQPVSGQTGYPVNMPAYPNYAMAPPPSSQYSYASYQTPSAYPQAQTAQPPVYTGSLYGGVFTNPPPSYSSAYAPSYTATPPPQVAPPYPPPSTTSPPPAQAYTEGYQPQSQSQPQPTTQQPPYNVFSPYAFTSGYGVNTGFGMVPGYGSAVAPVSPSSFTSYVAPVAQVAQVPYGSPLPAYAPMQQTSTYGQPMSAMPFGVNMNRIPEAYVSSGMGGYASYGPVNAGPVMPQMHTFSNSFMPFGSEMNSGMASAPAAGAYPTAPSPGGY